MMVEETAEAAAVAVGGGGGGGADTSEEPANQHQHRELRSARVIDARKRRFPSKHYVYAICRS